jgi:D-sedoheptulose 7-phosphate isomerase
MGNAPEDMTVEYLKRIESLRKSLELLTKNPQIEVFHALTNQCVKAISDGGQIFFMGNGGSAAEATHIAAEFVSKCCVEHAPWPAIALNDSISVLTAIGNDFGFDEIFSRQIKAFCNSKSVVIGLSTSGESQNVLRALEAASELGAFTSLWTSLKNVETTIPFVKNKLVAPTYSTPRAQEIHLLWGHSIAEIIEGIL